MNAYLIFIIALLIFNWLLSLIVETLNVRNVSTEIPAEFRIASISNGAVYFDSSDARQYPPIWQKACRARVWAQGVPTP